MLLRHLVSQFLQSQAQAAFSDAMQKKSAPREGQPAPHATPLFVDGLLLYPSELDGGGILDLTHEKQVNYCELFTERLGVFAGRSVALIEVGEGAKAREATEAALKLIRPMWVISFGFASGLTAEARRGQIVMATRVINERGDSHRAGLTLAAGQLPPPGIHWGDLFTVDKLPESTEQKRSLAKLGAVAWDSDSYFIASAASAEPTFISVRVISEGIDDELPKAVKVFREQKTLAGKLGAATGALLDQPASLQKMWKLRDDAIKLSDRLARFLVGVVEQLPNRAPERDSKPGKTTT
jgi:adenosylhomocysteine nucleosidase